MEEDKRKEAFELLNKEPEEQISEEEKNPHSFKLWQSFLIWLGIGLLATAVVIIIVLKSPADLFKGYEEARTAIIVAIGVISLISSAVALYINWIITSLLLSLGLKIGKNEFHNYRSVLYYYLKSSWVYALWLGIIIIGTLIAGSGFITSIPSYILSAIVLLAFYYLVYYKMNKEAPVTWIFLLFSAIFVAVTIGFMIYTGNIDYAGQLA